MTAITVGTLAITRRKQLPFGQLRSQQSTAFGTRGYVGGTNDPTGLTHLGAREYDPTLGRFLSIDPIIDTNDPAQMNAYSYAHNNPLTKSDPDGLRPDGPAGGASYNDDRWASDRGMNAGYTKKSSKWVWKQTPKKDKESQRRYSNYRDDPSRYMRPKLPKYVPGNQVHRSKNLQNGPDVAGAVKRGVNSVGKGIKRAGDYVMSYSETSGICVSGSAMAGAGVGRSACFMSVGDDYAFAWVTEDQVGVEASMGFTVDAVRSNADSIDQVRGDAAGFGGSAGPLRANHRGTFGTRNSRGDIVHSFTVSAGAYGGLGGNFGSGYTHIATVGTVAGDVGNFLKFW